MARTALKICFQIPFISFLCAVIPLQTQGQPSPQRLRDLQTKYNWGSIYLSYGTIPDIITLVGNHIRVEAIKAKCRCSPPLSMVAFLNNYRQPAQRRSLAVFQINFSAQNPVAGFLTSNDLNGTINPVPITPQDVLIAADWVDLYLTHAKEWS